MGFSSTVLGVDHAAEDEHRAAAVTGALRTALGGRRVRNAPVSYSVSGQSVFTRFVKLPPSAPENVERIVRFEAGSNVPFPMEEVVWDYQLMAGGAGTELEAVIVAIKADILDRIDGAVLAAGCLPKRVDVAPLALYNAVRFNYADYPGCTLVLDIGAKTTQLLFVEAGRVFIRGVPIAGNQITHAIESDLGGSFAEAEAVKHDKAFVGLGGAYEDPADPVAARASKVVRGVLTRLHAEVARSIGFYRSQQGGAAPSRILLTGGGSMMPYMDLFFSEKLGVPVEPFNPLRNVAVGRGIDPQALGRSAHLMGEVVGLALRDVAECPLEVDLIPAATRARRVARERRSMIFAAAAALALMFGALWFAESRRAAVMAEELESRNAELRRLRAEEAKLKKEEGSFAANRTRADQLLQLARDRMFWVGLLEELNRITPTGVWITSLEGAANGSVLPALVRPAAPPQQGGPRSMGAAAARRQEGGTAVDELILEGFYEAYDKEALRDPEKMQETGEQTIKRFLNNLTKSEWFAMNRAAIEDPQFVKVELVAAQEDKLALDFRVRAKLKNPISLVP